MHESLSKSLRGPAVSLIATGLLWVALQRALRGAGGTPDAVLLDAARSFRSGEWVLLSVTLTACVFAIVKRRRDLLLHVQAWSLAGGPAATPVSPPTSSSRSRPVSRRRKDFGVATVHLVCGFLGVGKTTFASALAARLGAVRLSVDELYLRLFADGPTYELDQAALDRLLAVLNDLWPQIIATGSDVVLDFGFWRRALRDEVRARATAAGANVALHWLQCPDSVAIERCLARNGQRDAFLISREGYSELQRHFEAPTDDETYVSVDTSA